MSAIQSFPNSFKGRGSPQAGGRNGRFCREIGYFFTEWWYSDKE